MTPNRIDYLEKQNEKLKAKLANRDMWLDKLSKNQLIRDEILRERMRISPLKHDLSYPLPPVTYEDDSYIMRVTERFRAEVIEPTKEAAIIDAVKRWAVGKGFVTLIQIPEEHLLEILRVGAMTVRNNEIAKEVTDEIIANCQEVAGE